MKKFLVLFAVFISALSFGQEKYNITGAGIVDAESIRIEGVELRPFETIVRVDEASDLIDIDSSKYYKIDGKINMGTQSIEVPAGGFYYSGDSYFTSSLYSTADNYTLFVNKPGEAAGNVKGEKVEHYVSGTGSQIFNLDNQGNFGSIEFTSCNFGSFAVQTTSLGELTAYRQFGASSDIGLFRIADGLTFSGTWAGGFRITDVISLAGVANSTLFKVGTSLVFNGRCISDINAASLDPTIVIYDFTESNFNLDGGFQLTSASFQPNSSISVTTDETSIKAFFRDCIEIRNTRPGAEMEFITETVTTTTVSVPTPLLGTTSTLNSTWYSQTANNQLTYDSSFTKDYKVTVNATIDGNPGDEIALVLRQFDESAAAYVDLKVRTRNINNVIGGEDIALFNFSTRAEIAKNDRIELWGVNNTAGNAMTILSGSEVLLDEI